MTYVAVLMARLRRLCRIRVERSGELSDVGLRLVDRCIASTAADLREAGSGEDAEAVLYDFAVAARNSGVAL